MAGLSVLTHTHTPPWLTSLWLGKMTAITHTGIFHSPHDCAKMLTHSLLTGSIVCSSVGISRAGYPHAWSPLSDFPHAQALCGLVSHSPERDWGHLYCHLHFSHSVESGVLDPHLGFSVNFLSRTGLWVVVTHAGNWELLVCVTHDFLYEFISRSRVVWRSV